MERKCGKWNAAAAAAGILLFGIFALFFYRQAIGYHGAYASDLQTHIKIAANNRGYSILFKAMGVALKLAGIKGIAVLESGMVMLTWILTSCLLSELMNNKRKCLARLYALPLLFLTSLYIPCIYGYFYRKSIITQPWHNITYIGMRMFAVWTMISFCRIYDGYLENIKFSGWLSVAAPLLLATAVKPNFLLAFSFTLLTVLVADFWKEGKNEFRMDRIRNMILMGTTVLPSCVVLYGQSRILYPRETAGEPSGITLIWGSRFFRDGLLIAGLKCFSGLAFPVLVLLWSSKKIGAEVRFIYLMYAVTFLQAIILSETGKRAGHGNFYWGMYNSAYILYVGAVAAFINGHDEREGPVNKKAYLNAGYILLVWHILSGAAYFIILFMGSAYMF